MVVRLDMNKMKYSGWDITSINKQKKTPENLTFAARAKNVVCSDTIFQAEMY